MTHTPDEVRREAERLDRLYFRKKADGVKDRSLRALSAMLRAYADLLAKPKLTRKEIASIVCRHVPPSRMCDQGKRCDCWEKYALPCADALIAAGVEVADSK